MNKEPKAVIVNSSYNSRSTRALLIAFNKAASDLIKIKNVVCLFKPNGILIQEAYNLDDHTNTIRIRGGKLEKYQYKEMTIRGTKNSDDYLGHYYVDIEGDSIFLERS